MKVIPKNELIILLQKGLSGKEDISKEFMDDIFETYGDDYYKDGSWSAYELSNTNTKRKDLMREHLGETKHPFPENVGDLCEMNVDGTWIRGKIVDGYRFRDGIVTIKDESGNEYWCGADRKDLYRQV